jgi:hypothetical protein
MCLLSSFELSCRGCIHHLLKHPRPVLRTKLCSGTDNARTKLARLCNIQCNVSFARRPAYSGLCQLRIDFLKTFELLRYLGMQVKYFFFFFFFFSFLGQVAWAVH